jgi:hypothetical protein
LAGNALPTVNKTLTGTTTMYRDVVAKAPASMCVNSEYVSNEIDEGDPQNGKYSEQRI